MTSLSWFEVFPPSGCRLPDATAAMRPLEHRPRLGLARRAPLVVFELWLRAGSVQWLVGMERELSFVLPHQMTAQLRGLELVASRQAERPALTSAAGIRFQSLIWPMRTDLAGAVSLSLMQLAESLRSEQAAVVQWVVGPGTPRRLVPSEFRLSEALGLRPPALPDTAARRAWGIKTQEPVFGVSGRLGAMAGTTRAANGLIRQLFQALSLTNDAHACLRATQPSATTVRRLIAVTGAHRRWSGIVNAAELAALLAWPIDGVQVPGCIGPSLARASRKVLVGTQSSTGRILGASLHPADAARHVAMPTKSSLHHLHIIGPTGAGKSTVLANLILADAVAGHGVLVVEPKGDLVDDVLARLPEDRHDDVVVIEPSEHGPAVGLNPLAGSTREAERRADELLGLFGQLFGAAIGPRSSDVLLHALITAARLPDGTLTDVPILLTNPLFRRRALEQVNDPLVLAPFWSWFEALSDPERGQVIAPIMNKLRTFTARTAVRRLLGQAQPAFDLKDLFDQQRIVLVNLNKGLVGPRTAKLLGSVLLTQLWQAIQRRAAVPARQRHPVMVAIDEWQDYTGALDFGDVLAQARSLGVGFTLAHQHLAQLSPSLRSAVLANARSRLSFRPAQDDAAALAAVLGGGIRPADLERLGAFQAAVRLLIDGAPSQPFAVQTRPLVEPTADAEQLRRRSLDRFGVDGAAVDAGLAQRWQGGDLETTGLIGVTRRRRS